VFDAEPAAYAGRMVAARIVPPLIVPLPEVSASWSTLADVECEHIRATLGQAFFNQTLAARMLGIDRASLARKIARYAIPLPAARRGRPRRGVLPPGPAGEVSAPAPPAE
jgi:hypothetical protein